MHPEVLIIGGGVIGLSIARELHIRGVKRITLLEKGTCGMEASWAAAGMLSPQVEAIGAGVFFDLCCASRDLYPAFTQELFNETGMDVELDQTGTLYLAFNDDDLLEIDKRSEWQKDAGLAVEVISADDIRHREPSITPDVRAALFFQNDWQVENRKLTSALKCYAKMNGVEIHENTPVEKLIVEDGRVVGAKTHDRIFTAELTVAATGAWTSLIQLGDVDMPVSVEPVRGQIVAFEPKQKLVRHVICSSFGYLVPRMDGRLLAGSTSESVGFDKSVSETAAISLGKMACKILPDIDDLEIADQWAGLRPYAEDGLPVLGSVGGVEGLFIATAHYRNGILLAPLTAKLIADKLVNGTDSHYFARVGAGRFNPSSVGISS